MESTLKRIRSYESGVRDEKSLAELLASIKVVQECLEEVERKAKKDILKNYSGEVYYFPETQKKVYLAEGRVTKEYNIEKVYDELLQKNLQHVFFQIVKIQEGLIPEQHKVLVNSLASEKKGEPTITVRSMSKQELLEHRD
ncbi:MAG TPA: hypothetical protein PLY69_06875 [Bacteroidales bacterium]|nr:hypothetical protein [Bacteroidales bacterium]